MFVVRRLAGRVALCLAGTFLTYALACLAFDPIAALELQQPPPPQDVLAAKRQELGLDDPVPVRFGSWLGALLRGDPGSTATGIPIGEELVRRAGTSLRLFLAGTVLGGLLGVALGIAGALRPRRTTDHLVTFVCLVVLATPVFVLATVLKIAWLPVNEAAGTTVLHFTGETTAGADHAGWRALLDRAQHLALPTVGIALAQAAFYSRYQRAAMLEVLDGDYLRTARAKGLGHRRVLLTHGVRMALIPMTTLFAFGVGLLVTGGVFTERVFGWYGMGDWLVIGVQQQDATIVATVTLFVAVLVVLSGLLADLLLAALDPRVRTRSAR